MEPLTHFLTGACIGRAGFNRKTAYATLAAVLAAEAADLDVFWGFGGPVEELKHHRGITHTFVGAPMVAVVVVGAVWLLHRWRVRRSSGPAQQRASELDTDRDLPAFRQEAAERLGPGRLQPVRWGWLYLTTLVAALSHILLDWTNNYGVRPFYPFNPRWYAGSIVFIVEPVMWALLLAALIMPWLLGLADREIGVRRQPFRGRGWAIFALAGMAALIVWRWTERSKAMDMIQQTQVATAPVTRVALEPYPVNPYHWHAILETPHYYQTAEVHTNAPTPAGGIVTDPTTDILYKPKVTPAVEAAERTFLGRVYLDWGRWAMVQDVGKVAVPGVPPPVLPPSRTWSTVLFNDLRFDYSFLHRTRDQARKPLSGWVYVVDGHEEAAEGMGSREQKPPDGGDSQ